MKRKTLIFSIFKRLSQVITPMLEYKCLLRRCYHIHKLLFIIYLCYPQESLTKSNNKEISNSSVSIEE